MNFNKTSTVFKIILIVFVLFLSIPLPYAADNTTRKALILYYSKTGNTRAACEALQKALGADITEIKDLNDRHSKLGGIAGMLITILGWHTDIEPEHVDMSSYSLVILASPIWAAKVAPAMRTFIDTNRFDERKVAIFTTSDSFLEEKYQVKIRNLVKEVGGDVMGYFQVQAQVDVGGEKVPRSKEQIVQDAIKLVPEIQKIFSTKQ